MRSSPHRETACALPGLPSRRSRGFARRVLIPAVGLVLALSAWGQTAGLAQERVTAAGRQGSRLSADRFVDRVIKGEPVSCMYGNVVIDRDSIFATSDTAYAYRERDVYEFIGHVRIVRDGAVLTCDWGTYHRNFGTGDFRGNVRLVDGDMIGTGARGESRGDGRYLRLFGDALLVSPEYTVRGDTIFQDRESGRGEAFGRVQILEPGGRNLVTGDHAVFAGEGDVAEVDRRPELVSREQSGGPVHSTAGLMRFYRGEDRVVMIDTVNIRQGRTLATADTAEAFGKERMVLTGTPTVSFGRGSTMFGERMEFFYRDGELKELVITGKGRMEDATPDSLARIYQGLPTMDILEGDSITVDFEERRIRRSVVVGHAHSRYTPVELSDEIATNDVTGDTITIHFRQQKVARVRVVGNADGNYRFAKVAAMREMQGKSRRLVDMLVRARADSAATGDSLATGAVESPEFADLAARLDSLAAAGFDTSRTGLDFLANAEDVKYGGHQVTFELAARTMEIERDGRLDYGKLKLTADHIKLDTDKRELYAEGKPLVEESDMIAGERMGYNFEHKSAAVADGVTSFDNYYYVGDNIRRFGDQTMKICGGRMTSCDLESPHYHFWSGKMKMRPGDKVVAAPVVLRIGHMPVFALPFYYKNLKEGRQSGILFPSFDFGWSSREGRYIRDFGYYWAASDYMDFEVEGDYNERRDFAYRASNRYVKRYGFNGGVDYSRKIGLGEDNQLTEWQLRWNHNQPKLWDDYTFRADVKMASTTLTSNDLAGSTARDVVNGQLKSNAYLSRSWGFGNANLSANRDERTNATDSDPATDKLIYNMTMPSLSMSFKQWTLGPALRRGKDGSTLGNMLRNTYFQQGYTFRSDRQGYENHEESRTNANGTWSLSFRPPRLGIFNVSLSANGGQAWSRETKSGQVWRADTSAAGGGYYDDFENTVEKTQPNLGFSTGLGTTLYGLIPLQVGRLQALRHTARFNTSWNLSPGLGSRQAHRTSVGLSLDNRIDVKYLGADSDSTLAPRKLDGLIDWSLSTSYSPKAPHGTEWSEISSGLAVKPGQSRYLQLKVSNSIDPYSLALKRTSFTYGLNFSGRLDVGQVPEAVTEQRNPDLERLGVDLAPAAADTSGADEFADEFAAENRQGMIDGQDPLAGEGDSFNSFYDRPGRRPGGDTKDPTEGGRYIPFDVSSSLSYSYTNKTSFNPAGAKRASANVSFNTQLTRNWEFRYSASFDLAEGTTIRQQYSLNRDLHCWRFEFNRTISTFDSQFGFRIFLKSIQALKFARGREDYMSMPSGGLGGSPF
jgi:lipopolysaccharide assembly outer membrane protein LptD (OstA)